MSSALRSAVDASTPSARITPSTTISGAFPLLIDAGVRSCTLIPDPGSPGETICAPATRPASASTALVGGTGSCSALTRPTVNGTRVPAVGSVTPVTTTASRLSTARAGGSWPPPSRRRPPPRRAARRREAHAPRLDGVGARGTLVIR
jgi:hypothetical protein